MPKPAAPGTRLPDELREALREEAFKRAKETGKEPSWGSLLWEKWQLATKSHAGIINSDDDKSEGTETSPSLEKSSEKGKETDVRSITISADEEPQVKLLLEVLRTGSQTHREAILWNLRGWAESAREAMRGGTTNEPVEISDAIDNIIQSSEALSLNEKARHKWVEELRRLQTEFGEISSQPRRDGKIHRARRG